MFISVWGHEQMAGHCPSGFFGRQQNSCFHLSSLPGPEAANQPQTITLLSPPYFTVGMMFYFWNAVLLLRQMYLDTHLPKSSTFVSSVHRVFSQKSWGSSRCFLAKLRRAFMFFLLSSGFRLGTHKPFLPSLFLMVESWTLTLTEASEALQFFRCCCGVFCDLLDESSLRSWGNFGRSATPGKVHHCSMFLPFVDNGSHCGLLESQSFRNGFITFSRLIDLNYFLSHLFLNFVGSQHDVQLLRIFWSTSLCQAGPI